MIFSGEEVGMLYDELVLSHRKQVAIVLNEINKIILQTAENELTGKSFKERPKRFDIKIPLEELVNKYFSPEVINWCETQGVSVSSDLIGRIKNTWKSMSIINGTDIELHYGGIGYRL